ncbi:uncharacterized protein LOC143027945 [Oratosquilla oratoria]|uniref:uncharacterized protein LOC143027945 n=1 Tax=Oratosquilla oratoria TaxID=337810 RepID=UPI003F776090
MQSLSHFLFLLSSFLQVESYRFSLSQYGGGVVRDLQSGDPLCYPSEHMQNDKSLAKDIGKEGGYFGFRTSENVTAWPLDRDEELQEDTSDHMVMELDKEEEVNQAGFRIGLVKGLPRIRRNSDSGDFVEKSISPVQLRFAAGVICRYMGFTHFERVFKAKPNATREKGGLKEASSDPSESFMGRRWYLHCSGYEPTPLHCSEARISSKLSKCTAFFGLRCGTCNSNIKLSPNTSVTISSPGFPYHYADDSICLWRIQGFKESTLSINFTSFSLPRANDKGQCIRGVVEILEEECGEGEGEDDEDGKGIPIKKKCRNVNLVASFCGGALPEPVTTQSSSVVFRMVSGVFHPRRYDVNGFQAVVTSWSLPKTSSPGNNWLLWKHMGTGEILATVAVSMLLIVSSVLIYFVYKRHRELQSRRQSRRAMEQIVAVRNLQDCPRPRETRSPGHSYGEPPLYEEVGSYLMLDGTPPALPPYTRQKFLHPERSSVKSSICFENCSEKAQIYNGDNQGVTPCSTSRSMDLNIMFGSAHIYNKLNNVPVTLQASSTCDTYHLKATVTPPTVVGTSKDTSGSEFSSQCESKSSRQEPHEVSLHNICH